MAYPLEGLTGIFLCASWPCDGQGCSGELADELMRGSRRAHQGLPVSSPNPPGSSPVSSGRPGDPRSLLRSTKNYDLSINSVSPVSPVSSGRPGDPRSLLRSTKNYVLSTHPVSPVSPVSSGRPGDPRSDLHSTENYVLSTKLGPRAAEDRRALINPFGRPATSFFTCSGGCCCRLRRARGMV